MLSTQTQLPSSFGLEESLQTERVYSLARAALNMISTIGDYNEFEYAMEGGTCKLLDSEKVDNVFPLPAVLATTYLSGGRSLRNGLPH